MNGTRFSSAGSEAQARAQISDQVSVTGRSEGLGAEVASDTAAGRRAIAGAQRDAHERDEVGSAKGSDCDFGALAPAATSGFDADDRGRLGLPSVSGTPQRPGSFAAGSRPRPQRETALDVTL
jgi:hypothetical protein